MKKEKLYIDIKQLIEQAKNFVVRNVNTTLLFTNYHIGKMIIEDEQQGKERAAYAEKTLKNLSKKLTKDFGKGYSVDNLQNMRNFYLLYYIRNYETVSRKSENDQAASALLEKYATVLRNSSDIKSQKQNELSIWQKVFAKFQFHFPLSWSHYVFLMKINNEDERNFYEIESAQNNWSIRELQRQYNSSLYERLALSKNKKTVKELSKKGQLIDKPIDMLKEPYVLEFLDLKEEAVYTESELETAIINRLESFLLELGKGFLFQSRQQRISFNGKNFYIDLIFYNRLLKCFVLIDLKIGELTHQNIGQMQMYVNYYDRKIKNKYENKTVGIILCKQTNKAVIEYTLPESNNHIFAREYKLYLPSKKQLQKLLE
ncbi:MAG: PDDEXK nuclease domain-containing protein [Ignavibacteriaceae bacterium]